MNENSSWQFFWLENLCDPTIQYKDNNHTGKVLPMVVTGCTTCKAVMNENSSWQFFWLENLCDPTIQYKTQNLYV